jgi:hypothetical protein
MAETRECIVHGGEHGEPKRGWFHQFGTSYYSDGAGDQHDRTVAIVEMEDGRVIEVEPSQVRFVPTKRNPLVL